MKGSIFPENIIPVEAIAPATDSAGKTGDYLCLKNLAQVFVVVHITQGAANTSAITIEQATDVAGTGSTAITKVVPIWANQDCAASDTLTRQTDAVSFTTSAAVKHKIVIFKIDPALLATSSGFDCITVKTGASSASNIVAAQYLCVSKYAQDTPPTVITD